MERSFAQNIEVLVHRNGREVARVVRPLRMTPHGPAVRYKRQLWPVVENAINLSGLPVAEPDEDVDPVLVDAGPVEPLQILPEVPDGSQKAVIDAPPDARLLVDAGPGTGKTHTACMRVAALVKNYDVPASRIWIISFTRTAVYEIRTRLGLLLEDEFAAAAVRIVTLDSLAWTVHSGFSKDAALTGSYDDNISQTLKKIRDNPDVQEEFLKLHHLVVDEAQDIVDIRAELVLAMIAAVRVECGITVFADQAQAIYGFTEDDERGVIGPRLLEELPDLDFQHLSLTEIHRTDSPALLKIFRDVRTTVLDLSISSLTRGSQVRTRIEELADERAGATKDLKLDKLPQNGLVLMRQRADVLFASSFNQDTRHRLRMSGLPVRILPWVAQLFWNHGERRLIRTDFDRLWREQVAVRPEASVAGAIWQLMVDAAGESHAIIDVHRLRTVLGRSGPPAMFTSSEYGDAGPIIGTIHASKGREAEEVCLYLPPEPENDEDEDTDLDEEIRVMFVGATRARKKLSVGSSPGRRSGSAKGRVWRRASNKRVQVEIGRAHDINARGLVGRSTFASVKDARKAQEYLLNNPFLTGIRAFACEELDWNFAIETPDGLRLGALSEKVGSDLKEVAKKCGGWAAPRSLAHIRSIGVRSIVLRPEDSSLDELHEPWRSSGFVLAPMLTGICMGKLP
jgi:hypothetical protein